MDCIVLATTSAPVVAMVAAGKAYGKAVPDWAAEHKGEGKDGRGSRESNRVSVINVRPMGNRVPKVRPESEGNRVLRL